jgi:acylphosphatase
MSDDDLRRTVRVRIEGLVQGVGFRYFTQCAAAELGVAGFVRNRYDGSVEALFAGSSAAVAAIIERCHHGPAGARVARVRVIAEGGEEPSDFRVLPTDRGR